MAKSRREYTWFFNGIKVTKRYLLYNYGSARMNEFQQIADVYFASVGSGLYDFGNGISVSCKV